MAAGSDDGEVEFLDVGPESARWSPSRTPRSWRPRPRSWRSRRWWWLVALAVAGLVVAGVLVGRSGSDSPTGRRAGPSVSIGAFAPVTVPTPARRPVVTVAGRPLLGVRAGWELFARGPDELLVIQPARGRVIRTPVPVLASTGDVSFVVANDRVLIRPLDVVPGYEVPDGQPARELPAALRQSPMFAGPRPDEVWVPTGVGRVGGYSAVQLLGVGGRPVGRPVSLPAGVQTGQLLADGGGGLMFSGVGGYYRLGPRGWRRFTSGVPLAVGPTRIFVAECDAQYSCSSVRIDAHSGRRTAVPYDPRDRDMLGIGVISPDGRQAAIPAYGPTGENVVRLVDLRTSTQRFTRLSVDIQTNVSSGTLVWSPDSRWVFGVGPGGVIGAVDARTGALHTLGVQLPSVTQLGVRALRPGG